MRNAKHRHRTWAERHEQEAILMIVLLTGIILGLSSGFCVFFQ